MVTYTWVIIGSFMMMSLPTHWFWSKANKPCGLKTFSVVFNSEWEFMEAMGQMELWP